MMQIFIISDIFGRTPALEQLCDSLSGNKKVPDIIDPYGGVDLSFKSEARAYAYFMEHVGLDRYGAIIEQQLQAQQENRPETDTLLIGFSVGGAAVWQLSENRTLSRVVKAICFYSSQIRHRLDIRPEFDIELIFPRHEPHFNVDDTISHLGSTHGVFCRKAAGNHGFMNKLSQNFNLACYTDYIRYLRKRIRSAQ